MIVELHVRDLGVIDDVSVAFGPGMTVLTGETGAGKTLLVDALALLLGGRADPASVRAGADDALVEGRFVDEDGADVVLARTIVRAGRSRAWVDGRMASVGAVAEAAGALLELHGQHEHRSLVTPETQRQALDAFGAVDTGPLVDARRQWTQLLRETEELGGDAEQRARDAELLAYQVDEIERAGIDGVDEDRQLEAEEDRLAEASAHRAAAAAALTALVGSGGGAEGDAAVDRLQTASQALTGRTPLAESERRVRAAMAELGDVAGDLRVVVETWEDDPQRLEQIRTRRQHLHELARKYGGSLEDVVGAAVAGRARLTELAALQDRALALDTDVAQALDRVHAAETVVAAARRRAAPQLAAAIEATLHELAMPSARFTVLVDGPGSADDVRFELAANPGEPARPLARTASGGELARTMLAVRLALTGAPGVLVFDEVDAGVGGEAATAVGAALAELGRNAEVLVVTHVAQVAAQADGHVEVRKVTSKGRTRSDVTVLDPEGRVVELSRMLSGSPDSESARRHARELLERGGAAAGSGGVP